MTNRNIQHELLRVFSDAHIVDIDMSQWDVKISIWVLADHYFAWSDRMPLVAVDFQGVAELSMSIPRLAPLSDQRHYQWRIHDFVYSRPNELHSLKFWGIESSPIMTIVCEGIQIRLEDHAILDRLNPKWTQPYSGFARLGPAASAERHKRGS